MQKPIAIAMNLTISFLLFVPAWASESLPFLPGDQLDAYWVVEKKVAPNYSKVALSKSEQGCATVAFVIEPDGTTSNHNIVVSSSDLFRKSSVNAAKEFLYEPSEDNAARDRVITINTFTYQISQSEEYDEEVRKTLAEFCDTNAMEMLMAKKGGSRE